MVAEDDLKLFHQILTARGVPKIPETLENDDVSVLLNELVAVRGALIQFSRGNFDIDLTGRNVFMATLKTLQAHLRHLTWQVGEIAKGDFSHRVDFMGDFSKAFNSMVSQLKHSLTELKDREASLLALTANLKTSEERWNLAVQCSRDGIWDINIDNRTAWYSGNFMHMMHYTTEDLPQELHWESKIHPEDSVQAGILSNVLQGIGELLPFSEECRFLTGQGDYRWVQVRGMPVHSESGRRLIAVVSDISAQKMVEASLMLQAMYDNLTGLPNRHLLDDRLKQAVANSKRGGNPFIFVTLDLDFFKEVNDTYGHIAGDKVLVELAERLRVGLRNTDTAARLGGDEFVAVFACDVDKEEAMTEIIMSRLYERLKPPVMLDNVEYQLRVSAGVAFFPKHAQNLLTLFEHADVALYKSKEKGKNQYTIFEQNNAAE